jgi:hypothetical protein
LPDHNGNDGESEKSSLFLFMAFTTAGSQIQREYVVLLLLKKIAKIVFLVVGINAVTLYSAEKFVYFSSYSY